MLQYTSITSEDVKRLQAWYEDTLAALRPNAVGLVDAFDLDDMVSYSSLDGIFQPNDIVNFTIVIRVPYISKNFMFATS